MYYKTYFKIISFLLISCPVIDYAMIQPHTEINSQSQRCLICLDEKGMLGFTTLTCTHSFCTECLTHIIDTSIHERSTAQLRCPLPECARQLNETDIQTIFTNKNREKITAIAAIQTHEWIAKQPNAKHCPTLNCPYVFLNDNPQSQTIRCPQCNEQYCSNCLFLHDQKMSCRAAEAERTVSRENQEWLQTNTKPCPQCGTRIEKNGGCDYVTCRNCRHGFCLNCYGTHHVGKCTLPPVNPTTQANQSSQQEAIQVQMEQDMALAREIAGRMQGEVQRPVVQPQFANLAQQQAQAAAQRRREAQVTLEREQAQQEAAARPQEFLYQGILNDSAENIMQAVGFGADVNQVKNGKTLLLLAILLERYNAIEALLQLGANPDDICAQQVIKMRSAKSLLLLIRYGYRGLNIDEIGATISVSVSTRCYIKDGIALIMELVNQKYDINEFWYPAIMLAYFNPTEGQKMVRFLINQGANPNHIYRDGGYSGSTPLSAAAVDYGNKQVVEILMKAGADINNKVKLKRRTPCSLLSLVIERINGSCLRVNRKEVMEFLLEHGANL